TSPGPSTFLSILASQVDTQAKGRAEDSTQVYKTIVAIPWYEAEVSTLAWANHLARTGANRGVFAEQAYGPAITTLHAALRNEAWRVLYAESEQAYFAEFRQAVRARGGSVQPSKDVALLRKLLQAEAKFLSATSVSALDGLFEGEWGNTVRTSLEAEQQARVQMMANIQRSAFLGGAGLAAAVSNIFTTQVQTEKMKTTFSEAFSPVQIKSEQLRLEIDGKEQALIVEGARGLRAKLVGVYMDVIVP
ncbi:MAG: hypothetical protein V4792_05225, partial [Pseudomonadota bacterium]